MKAVVNNEVLSKGLKNISSVIKKNTVLPILSSIKFEFTKNKLQLTATDLETTFITSVDCECKTPFSFPMEATDIMEVCSNVASPIEISLTDKVINIISGKYKGKFTATGSSQD